MLRLSNVLGSVNPSDPSFSTSVVFSSQERKGVIAMGVAALTSCVLVSILLLFIITSAVSSWKQHQSDSPAPFVRKQIALLVICLFVADLIQSVAGVLQLKWVREGQLYEGVTCTAQATMILIGDVGSSVWSCAIASYTFSSIVLGRHWSRRVVYATIIAGWTFIGILTIIGPIALETPSKGHFFGIAGAWCFITSNYSVQRLGIHYVPWFTAAIIIPVSYGLVFLSLRGNITFLRSIQSNDAILRERLAIAKRMLWYPAAFLVCISPITVIRLIGMRSDHIPFSIWMFGMSVLFLLGAIDSVIYATTRILIKPIKGPSPPSHLRRMSGGTLPAQTDNGHYGYFRKPKSKDIDPAYLHRVPDVATYPPWVKLNGGPHSERKTLPGAVAVHVTLEQTKEIM